MVRARGITPQPERRQILAALRIMERNEERDLARLITAVHAAKAAGGSIRDIAELTGKSTNTIQRWLKENS